MRRKIEYVLFWILLFLQNFAIISTDDFGISALVVFLLLLSITHNFYSKLSRKFMVFIFITLFFAILASVVNSFFNGMQILRAFMIIFTAWSTSKYIEYILKTDRKIFWSVAKSIMFIFCLYGIYQYFAVSYGMPHFLNVFNNNNSYTPRTLYGYFGGWTGTLNRVYGVFSEPSFYASFMCLCFLLLNINKTEKTSNILKLLILINIYLTGSRSGWAIIIFIIISLFVIDFNSYGMVSNKIVLFVLGGVPVLAIIGMSFLVDNKVYTDVSAYSRIHSTLFYLGESFKSLKNILVGHALGFSWSMDIAHNSNVEAVSHNGYIEILYSLGLPFFLFLVYSVLQLGKTIQVYRYKMIFFVGVVSICVFGSEYNIESIIGIMAVIYSVAHYLKWEKVDGENAQPRVSINRSKIIIRRKK